MTKIIEPETFHRCTLPSPESYPFRTLAQCADCGRWWWGDSVYCAFGFNKVWSPVRWYHWRLRRTIKEMAE